MSFSFLSPFGPFSVFEVLAVAVTVVELERTQLLRDLAFKNQHDVKPTQTVRFRVFSPSCFSLNY